MVQAFSQTPLSEDKFAAVPPIPYNMSGDLRDMLSSSPDKRTNAAESLKRFGDENAARALEGMLLGGRLSSEVRSDARNVLLDLSSKYREYLVDMSARVRRMKALAIPIRTKTPPRGMKALQM